MSASSTEPKATAEPARPPKSKLRENVESLAWAVVLFLIFRTFVLQAFRIPSESMEDTLLKHDFLFVSKFTYGATLPFTSYRLPGLRDMERGDVVVFKNPGDDRTDYIKRCVAIAGDTVQVIDDVLYINNVPQDEPYVKLDGVGQPAAVNWPGGGHYYVVPEDSFFAMGDNRHNSSDSRFFRQRYRHLRESAVPFENVVGKALFIYASFDGDKYFLPRLGRMFRPVK